MFLSYKPVIRNSEFIVIPYGRQVPILHIGSVKLQDDTIFHNVLHIPQFQYNLISVQRLCTDMNCSMSFDGHICVIQDHLQKGKQILLGRSQGGLYNTSGSYQGKSDNTSFLNIKEDLSVCHLRLEHVID